MTLKIDFPPELDARLREEAARQGQEAADSVRDLVKRQLVMREYGTSRSLRPSTYGFTTSFADRLTPR